MKHSKKFGVAILYCILAIIAFPFLVFINIKASILIALICDLITIIFLIILSKKNSFSIQINISMRELFFYVFSSVLIIYLIGPWGIITKDDSSFYLIEILESLVKTGDVIPYDAAMKFQMLLIFPALVGKYCGYKVAKMMLFLYYVLLLLAIIIVYNKFIVKEKRKIKVILFVLFFNAPNFIPAFFLNAVSPEKGTIWPPSTLQDWFGFSLIQSNLEVVFTNIPLLLFTLLYFLFKFQFKIESFNIILLLIIMMYSLPLGISLTFVSVLDLTRELKKNIKIYYIILFCISIFILQLCNGKTDASSYPFTFFTVFLFVFFEIIIFYILSFIVDKKKAVTLKDIISFIFLVIGFCLQLHTSNLFYCELSFPILLLLKYNICLKISQDSFWKKNNNLIIVAIYIITMGVFSSLVTPLNILKLNINTFKNSSVELINNKYITSFNVKSDENS